MRVAVAGTFDVLHDGHRSLLMRAFEIGDYICIGITNDEMASERRDRIIPLEIRRSVLETYLKGMRKPWEVFVIEDIYGPRETMDAIDVLVVSEDTLSNGKKLNEERKSRGVAPLEFSVVSLVMADDGKKISSSGILEGRYGRDGSVKAMDLSVGSMNPVKIEAVRAVMERIYGSVRITSVDAESDVPEQPFESDVRIGAINRARNALGGHDMAVGIEAGVFEMEEGLFDIQYCAVIDKDGYLTVGMGPGFAYPEKITALVRKGKTVSEAISELYGDEDIGKKHGAVGMLSNGLLNRKTLTEQAVTAAMIPRISKTLGY
ncbi:MAG TPA: inosine/xanthosine triphosphatase [Candidatus Methanomethylophilaceae archaeon]|nr:inosine/xanthosine triphosphatase [Candidatus Methanomethylophilaceae archaeon]